jgi:precorrin-6A/cobalt-precorrin-6A reductase
MQTNLLILGGTAEASVLAQIIAKTQIKARLSYAGRVDRPRLQPLEMRVGGFGGVAGLAAYLREEKITHLVDATHPFAAQMSHNAHLACAQADVKLLALTRPAWTQRDGDNWTTVPNLDAAVMHLDQPARRVMLAIGRQHLALFYAQPHHTYLLRLVDPPETKLAFDHHILEISRGPFTVAADTALIKTHQIDLIVAKNSGGNGAYPKIEAARNLGLPVIMIDRPVLPQRAETDRPELVMDWLVQP